MALHRRVIAITSGLVLAGGISGALSGILAIEVAVLIYVRTFAPLQLLSASSVIGAVFGAIVAPVLAWSALRRVPLGRAIAGIAVGAGLGGAIGVLAGASAVNPYVPFAINLPPVPQGLLGAFVGAALAAGYLRIRSRRGAIAERAG